MLSIFLPSLRSEALAAARQMRLWKPARPLVEAADEQLALSLRLTRGLGTAYLSDASARTSSGEACTTKSI